MNNLNREKIRILHCMQMVGSGGVEQRRLSLARGLSRSRYEQRLICTKAFGGLPPQFAAANCRIDQVGVFKHIFDSERYRAAIRTVRQFRPHIIHGAVYEGVALAVVAGQLGRVPVIIGEETSDPVNRRIKGHLLYRLLAGLTHHMVGVSPAVVDYLVHQIHLPARKVSLINNGVQEKVPASADQIALVRTQFGVEGKDLVIGTVGRLFDSYKRVSDLIRALVLVRENFLNTHLLIVGDGPDRASLEQLASELGVKSFVHFAGYQSDPQPFYAVMDIFALASASEAFGLVLVEAMFAALPVVATRVGGIPSIVVEGETGALVAPFEPRQLADELLKLAANEARRHAMGERARERARAEFSAERYVSDVDRLYQRLLAQGGLR